MSVCPLEKSCDVCTWFIPMYFSGIGGEVEQKKCVMQWMPILTAELIKSNVELVNQGKDSPISKIGYGPK